MLIHSTTLANNVIDTPSWLSVSVFSFAILIFTLIVSFRFGDLSNKNGRWFIALTAVCALNLVFNCLSSLSPNGDSSIILLKIANFLNYSLTVLLFVIYAHYLRSLVGDKKTNFDKALLVSIWVVFLSDAVLCLLSIFNSMYFSYSEGVYSRGEFFYIHLIFLLVMALLLEAIIIFNRQSIRKGLFWALVVFPLVPFAGMGLQIVLYGIPFGLAFTSFAIMVLSYFRGSHSLDYDYLTGCYSRKKLDYELSKKIREAKKGKPFIAILVDIDAFKEINDTLGHTVGDMALQEAAMILKKSLKNTDDFVARYGGDEFCIVSDNIDKASTNAIIDRIKKASVKQCLDKNSPYKITFSMGILAYEAGSNIKLNQFISLIDKRMYEDKRINKLL